MSSEAVRKIAAAMTDEDRGESVIVGEVAAITPFGGVEVVPPTEADAAIDQARQAYARRLRRSLEGVTGQVEDEVQALVDRVEGCERDLVERADALVARSETLLQREEQLLVAGREVLEIAELVSSAASRIAGLLTPAEVKVVDVIRDEAGLIASAVSRMEERPSSLLEAVRAKSFDDEVAELVERAERAAE